jgi:hypothetical protein
MTKREALAAFRELTNDLGDFKRGGRMDKPMRDEAWNNYVDGLIRSGEVSQRAYWWSHPFNDRANRG